MCMRRKIPDGYEFNDQSVCNLHTGAKANSVHWKGSACEERRRLISMFQKGSEPSYKLLAPQRGRNPLLPLLVEQLALTQSRVYKYIGMC